MEYFDFLNQIKERVQECMGDEYSVCIESVLKNNSISLDGLIIKDPKQSRISPNIYLNSFYDLYKEGISLETIVKRVVEIYYDNNQIELKYLEYVDKLNDYQQCKDMIVMRLHNKQMNYELIKDCPYEVFNDLIITYHYMVEFGETSVASIRITNSIFEAWNVNREEFRDNAMSNTVRLFPPKVCYIRDMIKNLINTVGGYDIEISDFVFDEDYIEDESFMNMFVVTNCQCNFGAIAFLYNGLLKCIADKLQSDLIILPSSIHEIICMKKTEDTNVHELLSMVKEVNDTHVKLEEILGYNLYIYSRKNDTIDMISEEK